jgi:hypothetical protein
MAGDTTPPPPDFAALTDSINRLTVAVGNMGKTAGDTSTSFSNLNLGTGKLFGVFGGLVEATAKGQTGMTLYNSVLDQSAEALSKALAGTKLFGVGIDLMTDAGKAYVKTTGAQTQELMTTYQGLAKVGAAGEASLETVYEDMRKFGATSAAELPKFTNLISQNSETLAKFGGSVSQGMKLFSDVAAGIQQTGLQTQFLNMGMTVDSINAGMAGYIKTQTQSGSLMQKAGETQKQYTDRLSEGAADYLKNLDQLSKLTGKSGEAIQKEREERLMNEQYSLHQRELQQKADAGDQDAKRKLAEEDKVLASTSGDARKGFMAAFSGMGMQTEEGRKLYMSAPEAFKMAASQSGAEAGKILDTAKGEFGKTMDNFGGVMMAAGNKLFVNVSDMRGLENIKGTYEERQKEVLAQQQKQIDQTGASVAAQTELLQLQRQTATNLSDMGSKGIVPVTELMITLAKKGRDVTDLLPGTRAEEEKNKPIRTQQAGGTQVGVPLTDPRLAQIPLADRKTLPKGTGDAEILKAAQEQTKAFTAEIQKSLTKIGDAAAGTIDDAIKTYIKGLSTGRNTPPSNDADAAAAAERARAAEIERERRRRDANPPPLSLAPQNPAQSQFTALGPQSRNPAPAQSTALGSITTPQLLANISSGVINLASLDNVRFPAMPTRYNSSMDTDASKIVAAENEKTKTVKSTSDNSNDDLIASNAMMIAKMDEFISLMRTSNGYQQKISQQTYA